MEILNTQYSIPNTKYNMRIYFLSTAIILILFLSGIDQTFSQTRIGVILPLMENSENPEDKVLGEEILKGITDALDEYNSQDTLNNIIIKTEDTRRDPARVLELIDQMGNDTNIKAIIGPVFSSEISSNAGAPAFHKIPLITPTATQNFLAADNQYIIQLNPTYETRGKLMGRYATKELNLNRFLILSEESYGIKYAGAFTSKVLKARGSVLSTQYFKVDDTDLDSAINELKKAMISKEKFIDFGKLSADQIQKFSSMNFVFSNTDSLAGAGDIVSIYKIFGSRADRVVDSAGIKTFSITKPDPNRNYIYGAAEAIYIPVSNPEKINLILPALRNAGLNLPVIGTSDWNNEMILKDNSEYIIRLYFESDYYLKDVSKKDLSGKSETAEKNYYMGYDAMKVVAKQISEGNNTRGKIYDALQKVTDFKAVHINYTIKNRSNHEMMIMKFENGRLEMVGDYVY